MGQRIDALRNPGVMPTSQDFSAKAEYIVPLNRDGRVASFSTRSTPASLKSSQSLSKPTG
jgi:hypothetical protein